MTHCAGKLDLAQGLTNRRGQLFGGDAVLDFVVYQYKSLVTLCFFFGTVFSSFALVAAANFFW
jgi:hypothetical protein